MKKNVLKLVITSLCISAFMGIIIILSGKFGELEGKILGTSCTIFGFSITGLCCSILYEKERYKNFSILGMLISLLGCIWQLLIIWGFLKVCIIFCSDEELLNWQILWSLIVLAISVAHISIMLHNESSNQTIVTIKNVTILFSIILDIMFLIITWDLITDSIELDFFIRFTVIFLILVTLGTVVIPILNKVYKNSKTSLDNKNNLTNNKLPHA